MVNLSAQQKLNSFLLAIIQFELISLREDQKSLMPDNLKKQIIKLQNKIKIKTKKSQVKS
jgi:hypothetical protein